MASENIKELTDANFEDEVLKSEVPTLVDFWAVWCGPCKQIAPMVDALADDYKGRVKVAKLDVDHNQIMAQQYGVKSIPTLLIFKGGKVVGQMVGAMPRSKLETEPGACSSRSPTSGPTSRKWGATSRARRCARAGSA